MTERAEMKLLIKAAVLFSAVSIGCVVGFILAWFVFCGGKRYGTADR